MQLLGNWFRRHFSDPQVVFLAFFLVAVLVIIITLGNMLTPVFASIVLAYLLEGVVGLLERKGWPRLVAVLVVLFGFMLFLALLLLLMLPLLWRQATDLLHQLPRMLTIWQQALMALPERYPELVTTDQILSLINAIRHEIAIFGQTLLSLSMSSVVRLITVIVYAVLMPLLIFFFLKDKALILAWFKRYMPRHRRIAVIVWRDLDRQIYNYVRGKSWEILIVWAVSFAAFWAFGLNFALLLAVLVGLSVVVPYIGASVVTIPVVLIAWFQWGWSPQLLWLTVVYLTIQAIDGNVLVPLLFSEVVNLHPVAIIVAILLFGGIWGFWGVFFAIPLATLVQAILCAWPAENPLTDEPVPATDA